MYLSGGPFLLCTVTFMGPPQGSQSGPACAKTDIGNKTGASVYILLLLMHCGR